MTTLPAYRRLNLHPLKSKHNPIHKGFKLLKICLLLIIVCSCCYVEYITYSAAVERREMIESLQAEVNKLNDEIAQGKADASYYMQDKVTRRIFCSNYTKEK